MLKHVQVSPQRSRADSVSLSSTASLCSLASDTHSLHHRAPSYTSLSDAQPQTTIKVYAKCLRQDIEYKTLSVSAQTSSREVVSMLLSKYRMKHRDPRLFYLTMEVAVQRTGVRTLLVLGDDARPAALQTCHPKGYSKFSLQTRRGGLVRIYDSALMSSSQYKSLLISERTTADELLALLLSCYNSSEKVEQFSLYEVCQSQEYQRKLHPDDLPLLVQQSWQAGGSQAQCHFLVRRNPDYKPLERRKPLLWSQEPAQKPYFSTMQQTLQSFSNLSLISSNLSEQKKSNSDNVLHNNAEKLFKPKNKSFDNILEESSEKWGNYINYKCLKGSEKVAEKSQCKCGKNIFCACKNEENSGMISSKSCHQIGSCYSPVYPKYPSISNYFSNRYSNRSFDTSSIGSIDSEDIMASSTPNPSPTVKTFEDSGPMGLLDVPDSAISNIPDVAKVPKAAPRTKIPPRNYADYENYFYI